MAVEPDLVAVLADLRRRPAAVFDVLAHASSRQVALDLLQQRLGVTHELAAAILDQQIKTLLPVDVGPPTPADDAEESDRNWTRHDIAREYGVPLAVVRRWARSAHFPKPIGRTGAANIYLAGEVRGWLNRASTAPEWDGAVLERERPDR